MRIFKKITKIEPQIIESYDVETTTYGCDICDFKNEDKEIVQDHYGKNHAVKESKKVAGIEFFRFESKEDLTIWAQSYDYDYDETDTRGWTGSGWYTTECQKRPCGRGCCTKYILCFKSLERIVSQLEEEIKESVTELTTLCKEFNLPAIVLDKFYQ